MMSTNVTRLIDRSDYILWLKLSSGIVSGLSIIGATIVLFSHTAWCKIRRNKQPRFEGRFLRSLKFVFCDYLMPKDANNAEHIQDGGEAGRRRRRQLENDASEKTHLLHRKKEESLKTITGSLREDDKYKKQTRMPNYHYFVICICIADIITSSSHIWGILTMDLNTTDFIHYVNESSNEILRSGTTTQCTAQAVVTIFATIASFLWTLALACSLCFSEYFFWCTNTNIRNWFKAPNKYQADNEKRDPHCCNTSLFKMFLCPLFGWGIPAGLFTALAAHGFLGFTQGFDIAWCYLRFDLNVTNARQDWIEDFVGYEIFVWGPLILIMLLFGSFTILLCLRVNCGYCIEGDKSKYKVNCAHVRYMSIALALVILRIANTISDIYILTRIQADNFKALKSDFIAVLTLIAGVTNSAQGLVNAFMFICCIRSTKECCLIICFQRNDQNAEHNRAPFEEPRQNGD